MTIYHAMSRWTINGTNRRIFVRRDVLVVCGAAAATTTTAATAYSNHQNYFTSTGAAGAVVDERPRNADHTTMAHQPVALATSTGTTRSFSSTLWNAGHLYSNVSSKTKCESFSSDSSSLSTRGAAKLALLPPRSELIQQMQNSSNEKDDTAVIFDLLIIGAGVNGCGIALDAASRGLTVACIDRSDICAETSSRSTKLIWAGIRYLATAAAHVLNQPLSAFLTRPRTIFNDFVSEFNMVRTCHRERNYMLQTQRHLCHWMPLAVPFTSFVKVGLRDGQPPPFGNSFFQYFPILGPPVFVLYDALGGFKNPSSYVIGPHKAVSTILPHLRVYKEETDANAPSGQPPQPWVRYLSVFGEGMHNDARTCLAIAQSAIAHGAVICNYVEAIDLIASSPKDTVADYDKDFDVDGSIGRIDVKGVMVKDQLTGKKFAIHAKQIVLAGGPFTDELRRMTEAITTANVNDTSDLPTRAIRESAGTHIVLRGGMVPPNMGLLDFNTSNGKFMFILPWLGHTLIGTTDDPSTRASSRHDPPEQDIEYLLKECQTFLQMDRPLQRSDVLSAWRGWRPLAVDPHAPTGAPVSRDHVISQHPATGIFFIAGGKWTSWREMAEELVDRVLVAASQAADRTPYSNDRVMTMTTSPCRTLDIVLHGGDVNFDGNKLRAQFAQANSHLPADIVAHLVDTYGIHVWDVAALWNDNADSSGTETRTSKTSQNTLYQRLVPDFPYIEAEVLYACRHEYACTVADVLSRRTRLSYLSKAAAQAALPRVAQLMADELQWSRSVRLQQVAAAEQELASFGGPEPVVDAAAPTK